MIFQFWLINVAIGMALFVAYRIVITETTYSDGNFFDGVLQVLDVFLNVTYAFVYLLAIVLSSLTIFLNLIAKIRNNRYLSLLTFLAIPLFGVIFIISNLLTDGLLYNSSVSVFSNLLTFSVVYLFFTTLQFLFFSKRVHQLQQ